MGQQSKVAQARETPLLTTKMKNRIIALYGSQEVGKTTSLKLLLGLLRAMPGVEAEIILDGIDVRAVVRIGTRWIGIESQGDPSSRLPDGLRDLVSSGCTVIVCATRNWGATCAVVDEYSHTHEIEWVHKRRADEAEDLDLINSLCAKDLLSKTLGPPTDR